MSCHRCLERPCDCLGPIQAFLSPLKKVEKTVAEWVAENAGDMYGDCLVDDPALTPEGLLDTLLDMVSESLPRIASKYMALKKEHDLVLTRLRAAEAVCKAAEEEIAERLEDAAPLLGMKAPEQSDLSDGWAHLPMADWKLARLLHQRGRKGDGG